MSTNNADFELNSLFDVKDKVALVTGGGQHKKCCPLYYVSLIYLQDLALA